MLNDSTLWNEGFGEHALFSRRRLLRMSATLGLAATGIGSLAGCGTPQTITPAAQADPQPLPSQIVAPHPAGVLGAGFNGHPSVMSFPALQDVKATWVRGFFVMVDADKGNLADQPVIQALLTSASRGYGTLLSLKFVYDNQPIPTPNTPAMAQAQQRLDAVLPIVMNKVDILAIGNEPFIECQAQDRNSDRLNVFYETMAQRAIDYRNKQVNSTSKTQLYMGALNHLDQPEWRTAATERWMHFVQSMSSIAGTDIHPHLPDPKAGSYYLNYILSKMRSDQTFLATEFSLVEFYKQHLTDTISADFAHRYHVSSGTPVWQVLKDAISHPFTQQKWNDFLSMSPWFADNKNFLHDQMESFRATGKLAVATYGIGTLMTDIGPKSLPWILVAMFCLHTVRPAKDGLPGRSTVWTDEFRSLQSQ